MSAHQPLLEHDEFADILAANAELQRRRADDSFLYDNPDRIRLLSWQALEGRDPPTRYWHLPDWLGADPCLLSGRGGAGKTLLAQAMGTALACGLEYFTAAPHAPVNVLLWACEDSHDELWRRQVAICRYFGIKLADLEGRFYVEARRGLENTLFATAFGTPSFTALRDELTEQVGDYQASVVILDNVGQLFGGNENDRHHVTAFINGVYGIGAPIVPHFAPVFLGHVAKSQGSEFSGNAAWENACRSRWYLGSTLPDQSPDDDEPIDPNTVYLAKRKANYSSKDYVRLTFQEGVLATPGAAVSMFDPAAETVEQVVLRAYEAIVAAGITPTDGRTSPDYLPAIIKRMDLSRTFSKKELAAAMGRLMGRGMLTRRQVGRYPNRSPRFGLVRG